MNIIEFKEIIASAVEAYADQHGVMIDTIEVGSWVTDRNEEGDFTMVHIGRCNLELKMQEV